MPPADHELAQRAKDGDREAFAQLVKKHQRRAYATAMHLTGQHSDADDVVQEALLRAYRGLHGFDGRAAFSTWLHRIVVNVALNHLRARRRPTLPIEAAAGVGLPPRVEPRAEARVVLAALAELSPPLRVTLVLATVEDMPYREIAETLGVPEGTVAWRVNQARKLLRLRLQNIPEVNVDEVLRRTKKALGAPG
ncbi:MAG TPA: sigma-70 family RNA polymerase sigma factor [Haliangiales bacterium]|nr:sigma-70 family RNA polymerase sigma factor [Haliangiales bacterium]